MSIDGSKVPNSFLNGSSENFSVALLDRHLIVRQGLESLLRETPGATLVASISDPDDFPDCFERVRVDALIVEIDFPGYDMLRLIRTWSKDFPLVALLVLTGFEESLYGERVIRAGARGFVEKSSSFDALLVALNKIREGKLAASPTLEALLLSSFSGLRKETALGEIDLLSDRELLVLTLIGQGHSTAQIAASMQVSPKTVGSYKERIKEKLGILDSVRLSQYAASQNLSIARSSGTRKT